MKKFIFSLIAFLLIVGNVNAQTTINVPTNYPTIQAAITAATAGDVIEVTAGTYALGVPTIVDKKLTIKNATGATVNITGNLMITADGVVIDGLKFSMARAAVTSGGGIADIAIKVGNDVATQAHAANTTITNCTFDGYEFAIYLAPAYCTNATITNNTFTNQLSAAVLGDKMLGTVTITGNSITNCAESVKRYYGVASGSGAVLQTSFGAIKVTAVNGTGNITVTGNTINGFGQKTATAVKQIGTGTISDAEAWASDYLKYSAAVLICKDGINVNYTGTVTVLPANSITNSANGNSICYVNAAKALRDGNQGTAIITSPVLNQTTQMGYPTIQAAITAATAGDVITVAYGVYDISRGTETINGQTGWYLPITKSITLTGIANGEGAYPVISSSTISRNNTGLASQQLITVLAEGVTIQNFVIENKMDAAKIIEIAAKDFTLKNVETRTNSLVTAQNYIDFVLANGGTSYYHWYKNFFTGNVNFSIANAGTSTLENVKIHKGSLLAPTSVVTSGTINLKNVTIDFNGCANVNEDVDVMSNNSAFIVPANSTLNVIVDNNLLKIQKQILDNLPVGSTLTLAAGTYEQDLNIKNGVLVKGDGGTVIVKGHVVGNYDAATVTVIPRPVILKDINGVFKGSYNTIAEAHTAAADAGDVITIADGEYKEFINIWKSITINGSQGTVITSEVDDFNMLVGYGGVLYLNNVTFNQIAKSGLVVGDPYNMGGKAYLSNCKFIGNLNTTFAQNAIQADAKGEVDVRSTTFENYTFVGSENVFVNTGATLTIASGQTLTNNGAITNKGTITNNGTLANSGTITLAAAGMIPYASTGTITFADGAKIVIDETSTAIINGEGNWKTTGNTIIEDNKVYTTSFTNTAKVIVTNGDLYYNTSSNALYNRYVTGVTTGTVEKDGGTFKINATAATQNQIKTSTLGNVTCINIASPIIVEVLFSGNVDIEGNTYGVNLWDLTIPQGGGTFSPGDALSKARYLRMYSAVGRIGNLGTLNMYYDAFGSEGATPYVSGSNLSIASMGQSTKLLTFPAEITHFINPTNAARANAMQALVPAGKTEITGSSLAIGNTLYFYSTLTPTNVTTDVRAFSIHTSPNPTVVAFGINPSTLRTITFMNGNDIYETQQVALGVIPTKPAIDPTKTDVMNTYTFTGWTPTLLAVTGNATYTATFRELPNALPTITSTLPDNEVYGTLVEFGVTTVLSQVSGNNFEGTMVKMNYQITVPTANYSIQYFETQNQTWYDLPLTGAYGPATGFPLAAFTSQFRLKGDVGVYEVAMQLVTIDGNHQLATLSAEMEITPLEATFTWDNSTFNYDNTLKTVTATVSNKVATDVINITYENNTATAVGTYTAKVTALSNANYKLPIQYVVSHDWEIKGLYISSFADCYGNTPSCGTISPSGNNLVEAGKNYTYTFTPSDANHGIYQVLVNGIANAQAKIDGEYTFTDVQQSHRITVTFERIDGVVMVHPAEMVAFAGGSSTHGGGFPDILVTFSGLVAPDTENSLVTGDTRTILKFLSDQFDYFEVGTTTPAAHCESGKVYDILVNSVTDVRFTTVNGNMYHLVADGNSKLTVRPTQFMAAIPTVTVEVLNNAILPSVPLASIGTSPTITNSAGQVVADVSGIVLIRSELVPGNNPEKHLEIVKAMEEKLATKFTTGDGFVNTPIRLALADGKNGNIYVYSANADMIELLVPYPVGSTSANEFIILHYAEGDDLTDPYDYDLDNPEIFSSVSGTIAPLLITKAANGLRFSVSNFSPFAIAYNYTGCPAVLADNINQTLYPVVEVAGKCWTKVNMRSKRYADYSPIDYMQYISPTTNQNLSGTYGFLYTYEAANAINPLTSLPLNPLAPNQGICPNGWRLPFAHELAAFMAYPVQDITYGDWIGFTPTNTINFSALPAGYYNAAADRYEKELGYTSFWSCEYNAYGIRYNCHLVEQFTMGVGDAVSVRCVKD